MAAPMTTMNSHMATWLLDEFGLTERAIEIIGEDDKVWRLLCNNSVVVPGQTFHAKTSLPPQGIVSTGRTLACFIVPDAKHDYKDELFGNLDKIRNREPPIFSANFSFPDDESLNRKSRDIYEVLCQQPDKRVYIFLKTAPRTVLCIGSFLPLLARTTPTKFGARPDNLSTSACAELDDDTRVAIETVCKRLVQLKRKREDDEQKKQDKKDAEDQARKMRRTTAAAFFRTTREEELEEGEIDEEEDGQVAPPPPPPRPRSKAGSSSSSSVKTVRFKIPTTAQTAAKKAAEKAAALALMQVAGNQCLNDILAGDYDEGI